MALILNFSIEFVPRPSSSVSGHGKDRLKMSGVKYFFVLKQEGFCLLAKYSGHILWHSNLKRVFTLLFSLKDNKRSVNLVNLKFVNIICCQFAFI